MPFPVIKQGRKARSKKEPEPPLLSICVNPTSSTVSSWAFRGASYYGGTSSTRLPCTCIDTCQKKAEPLFRAMHVSNYTARASRLRAPGRSRIQPTERLGAGGRTNLKRAAGPVRCFCGPGSLLGTTVRSGIKTTSNGEKHPTGMPVPAGLRRAEAILYAGSSWHA